MGLITRQGREDLAGVACRGGVEMYHGGGGGYPGGGGDSVGGNMQFRGPRIGVQGPNQYPNQQGHVGQQGGGGSHQTMGPRPMGQLQMQQVSGAGTIHWMV